MRRRHRRAPLLLPILALVLALGAACSDDGDDEGTNPTITEPSTTTTADEEADGGETETTPPADGEEPTTSEAGGTEPEPGGTVPGDEAEVLTSEQAQAQLEALLPLYRQAVLDTKAAGAVDERTLQSLSRSLTTDLASGQLDGLRDPARINGSVPELVPTQVEVVTATPTCAGGTVVIEDLDQVFAGSPAVDEPYWFRLEPAADGATAPGWRIALLNLSDNGQPIEEAMCA